MMSARYGAGGNRQTTVIPRHSKQIANPIDASVHETRADTIHAAERREMCKYAKFQ
jgi:hypothetical protein